MSASHANCSHPATKAGRAACRRFRLTAEYFSRQLEDRRAEQGLSEIEENAYSSAHQNADDTSVENDFAVFSAEWYEIFRTSFHSALNDLQNEAARNEYYEGE